MDGARFDHTGGRRGAWTGAGVLCLLLGLTYLFWFVDAILSDGLEPTLRQFVGLDQVGGLTVGVDRGFPLYALALLILAVLAFARRSAARGGILLLSWLLLVASGRFFVGAFQDSLGLERYLEGDFEDLGLLITQGLTVLCCLLLLILMMPVGQFRARPDADEEYDASPAPPAGYGRPSAGPLPSAYQRPGPPPGYPQQAYPAPGQPPPYAGQPTVPPRPPQHQQPRYQQPPPGYAPPQHRSHAAPPPAEEDPPTAALPQYRPDELDDDVTTTTYPRPDRGERGGPDDRDA